MKPAAIQTMVMAILIAFVSSYIVYFGFTTNYTTGSFSPASFKDQYSHGIYKYRVLSQYLLTRLDNALGNSIPSKAAERRLFVQDKNASERFYHSYYYLNTFFMALLSVVLVLLVNQDTVLKIPKNEKSLILFLVIIVVNLTQFVVCPYDISSYFFQLLIILIFLKYFETRYILSLAVICLLLILSTLNRESSALTLSFLAVVIYCKWGITRKSLISIFMIVLSFLSTYFALRYFIKTPDLAIVTIDYLNYNLFFEANQVGILFWALLLYFTMATANSKENKVLIVCYHIASLPYIWSCFTAGVLWEVRLYMPVFLGSLILGKIDPSFVPFIPVNMFYKAQPESYIKDHDRNRIAQDHRSKDDNK
jgi:hypothetical protein